MKKRYFDEKNGLWYELKGDYYFPCLVTFDGGKEEKVIGVWGQRHGDYLRRRKRNYYLSMKSRGVLNDYLYEVNERAENMYLDLIKQIAKEEGVDETLKATDMMKWVGLMDNICNRVREIVNEEVVNS